MEKNYSQSMRLFRLTALCTVLFSFAAHGYRFLSLSFSGDSMFIAQTEDALYQVSLGRFLQPLYWQIRGPITAPLTCGLFTTAFLIISSFLIIRLFSFDHPLQIILTCGLLTANETMAVSSAAYLPWMDVYALSLMLNVSAVYLFFKWKHGAWFSPLLMAISLGLYQSYLPTSSTLVILLLLQKLLFGEHLRSIWTRGIHFCLPACLPACLRELTKLKHLCQPFPGKITFIAGYILHVDGRFFNSTEAQKRKKRRTKLVFALGYGMGVLFSFS